jgi:predicted amidohydrolase YtcJ
VQTEILLLLVNGRVWTVNPAQPEAEAVAISGNRIVAVGANSEILSLSGSAAQTRIIDLRGRLVVPGFNDAHLHFYMGGDSLRSVNLCGATGHLDLRQKIGEYASTRKPGEWILNGNWNDQSWDPAELPFHQLIDDVTADNPVFVHRSDGHMSLANRVAMQIAGVDRSTSEVPGGEIVRDTNGDPTGVFKDTAKALIERVIPRPSQEYILQCLRAAQSHAIENGVTSVQDMGRAWQTRRRHDGGCAAGLSEAAARRRAEGPGLRAPASAGVEAPCRCRRGGGIRRREAAHWSDQEFFRRLARVHDSVVLRPVYGCAADLRAPK